MAEPGWLLDTNTPVRSRNPHGALVRRPGATEPDAVCNADIRAALERADTPIGSRDLFIAAHARSRGLTLVTHNLREFKRVPELQVEDWLTAPA